MVQQVLLVRLAAWAIQVQLVLLVVLVYLAYLE
jgi:hypothetical protein